MGLKSFDQKPKITRVSPLIIDMNSLGVYPKRISLEDFLKFKILQVLRPNFKKYDAQLF